MANPALIKTANGIGLLVNGVVIDPAGTSGALPQLVLVTFTNTDSAAVTWSNVGGSTQHLFVGPPVVTDGGGAIVFHWTNKTSTGATLNASAPWTGTVSVSVFST